MDVTSVLLAAATVLGTKTVEHSTKLAVTELWSSLKSLIRRQKGANSPAVEVLEEVERLPSDLPPTSALTNRVDALKLPDDPAIAALLQQVEALLRQRAPNIIQYHIEKQNNFHGGTFHNTNFN